MAEGLPDTSHFINVPKAQPQLQARWKESVHSHVADGAYESLEEAQAWCTWWDASGGVTQDPIGSSSHCQPCLTPTA